MEQFRFYNLRLHIYNDRGLSMEYYGVDIVESGVFPSRAKKMVEKMCYQWLFQFHRYQRQLTLHDLELHMIISSRS